jgi:hypothetical protein
VPHKGVPRRLGDLRLIFWILDFGHSFVHIMEFLAVYHFFFLAHASIFLHDVYV